MTIAIGILASSAPQALKQTLQYWRSDAFRVFIHLDQKVTRDRFPFLTDYPDISVIQSPLDVRWGGFSMVEAEIRLMREAVKIPDLSHFMLISDNTVPLFEREALIAEITNPRRWSKFIPTESGDIRIRYETIACFDMRASAPPHHSGLERAFEPRDIPCLEGLIEVLSSGKLRLEKLYHGSQWKLIKAEDAQHVVQVNNLNSKFKQSFKYSVIPDESYIHTILGLNGGESCFAKFMWADFSRRPAPFVLDTTGDLELARSHDFVFARKVHDENLISDWMSRITTP